MFVIIISEDYDESGITCLLLLSVILEGEALVTPDMGTGIVQSLPHYSNAKSNSISPEEAGTGSPNASPALAKEHVQAAVDSVAISIQSRQSISDISKKEATIEETKKGNTQIADIAKNSDISGRTISRVQFVYDQKGELSIRYLDSSDWLIYQVPSELMMRLKEAAAKSGSSVNMKA